VIEPTSHTDRSHRAPAQPFGSSRNRIRRKLEFRPRLGVEIGCETIRAVLVVRRKIVRATSVQVGELGSIEAGLESVFGSMPLAGVVKPHVFGAIGAASTQVRRLNNLPSIKSERALREVVHANGARFFLKNGIPLITSAIRREDERSGWAAAIEEPPVRALALACRSHRLKLILVAPAIIALPLAMPGESFVSVDGEAVVEAHTRADGALVDVRRVFTMSAGGRNGCDGIKDAPMSGGDDSIEYAVAYGATELSRAEPLAIHRQELRALADAPFPKWRIAAAIGACIASLLIAFALPAFRARREAAAASRRLLITDPSYRAARWTETELRRTTQTLGDIDGFAQDRRSTIVLLATITQALPQDVWLQAIHVDQNGGTATALGPRASSAVDGFAALHSLTSLAIMGAVLQQQIAQQHFERVTVRFRWRPVSRSTSMRSPSLERRK